MKLAISSPKDLGAGLIYLGVGIAAIVIARDYGMGNAVRMGPGYFPTVLGILLVLIGAISIVRSLRAQGGAVGAINWRGIALIAGAVLSFALLVRPLGLVFTIPLLIFVSAYASSHFRAKATLGIAIGLTVFCSLVFVKGLGIPLPLLGTAFGG